MKYQNLAEAEERMLAWAITDEAKALGLKGQKMPQETEHRIRVRVLKKILDALSAPAEEEKTYSWNSGEFAGARRLLVHARLTHPRRKLFAFAAFLRRHHTRYHSAGHLIAYAGEKYGW